MGQPIFSFLNLINRQRINYLQSNQLQMSKIGDLRVLPEKQLSEWIEERQPLGGNYQCPTLFMVNEKRMVVSFGEEWIWGEDPENTDKYSEILQDLAFEITYPTEKNQISQTQPAGFVLYRLRERTKITFTCLEEEPEILETWILKFQSLCLPQIGFNKYYFIPLDSHKKGRCVKALRRADGKQFCARIIPGKKQYQENKKVTEQIELINALSDENVLKVERYFLEEECSIIITEWIPENLEDFIPETNIRKLNPTEFKKIFYAIMRVIKIMNSMRYGHFSLYKEHILIREDKTAVLTGFSQAHTSKYAAQVKITPPPKKKKKKNEDGQFEILDPTIVNTFEVDSFFLGIILYEYISGMFPFDNKRSIFYEEARPEQVLLWEVFDKNPNVTPESFNLLKRLLHRDRTKRSHMGNLMIHPYFKQIMPKQSELKKERRKKNKDGLVDESMKSVKKKKYIFKAGKKVKKQEIVFSSVGQSNKGELNAQTQELIKANCQKPQTKANRNGGLDMRSMSHLEEGEAIMYSEGEEDFSYENSVEIPDEILHQVEFMEDEGESLWKTE